MRQVRIKKSTLDSETPLVEARVEIELIMCLAGVLKPIRVNLTNREGMNYHLILGRTALEGDFIVDVSRTFIGGKKCRTFRTLRRHAGRYAMNVSKRNRTHLIVAFVFALLFLLPATYKIAVLKYPVLSKPVENLWTFELKIHFRGTGKKDTIYHFLPKGDKGQTILREDFISQDLSFTIDKKDGNTGIAWKGSGVTGDVQLFYGRRFKRCRRPFCLLRERLLLKIGTVRIFFSSCCWGGVGVDQCRT